MNSNKEEWEENLKNAYYTSDSLSKDIKTLLEIIVYVSFGEKIGRLYKIINNNELFSKIIEEFSDCEIEFPSKDEFVESVMTAIVYYYKEILGYDWIQIQKQLGYERDMGLRYKRKIDKLGDNIKKRLNEIKNTKTKEEVSLFEI
jgi:hypothetical protein